LNDLIKLDDVGVIEQFEYLNLPINLAQIVVIQSRLVDDLDRNLSTSTNFT